MRIFVTLFTAGVLVSLTACEGRKSTSYSDEPAPTAAPADPAPSENTQPLAVPSDPNASFYVLDKAKKGEDSVIITKRVGISGISYSSRLYDCAAGTFKYLGTGETRAAMEQSQPDPNMTALTAGSIAYYVGLEACK
ncbi:hypothetical protein [Thiolinea disciformis]|uniref:hypothetical protein n=1 Tax=Thiolinea disciformis TaxID=125614 RepID=UPI00037FF246|nr:hypothetical protein [Thiolinea disciformis]